MFYSTTLVFLLVLYLFTYARRKKSSLDRIPTIGPSRTITSHLGALSTFFYGYQKIQEGYEKYPIFKIRRYFSWLIVVHRPEYLRDIARARDDQISFLDALNEGAQFDYTIGPELHANLYHINIARGSMTRNIAIRFADLLDETNKSLHDVLGGTNIGWTDVPCYHSAVHIISRVSSRFFVGRELSSNRRYRDIMQGYTFHITTCGFVISLLPTWLKPIVNKALFDSKGKLRDVEEYLQPIIEERLKQGTMEETYDESNDMITWLWNATPEDERTVRNIAVRMIFFNMAAIQTTSSLLTYVLFNLATYNSYIKPLREEISATVTAEGWTRAAMENMRKLDSFIKESQRLHGSDAAMVGRLAMSDFTFSDGTTIPKGSTLIVAGRAINHDERCYPNPQEFQGFRFAEKEASKWQMTALNPEFMTFGVGRHACPGRFFAITIVKAIVARILLEYDIKLANEQAGRPKNQWFTGIFVAPDEKACVSLRKRVS